MSPISRERDYARRRYEKWQSKQAEKQAKQRRQRRVLIISASAVAVVLVIAGATLYLTKDDEGSAKPASASASASPSSSASAAASPSASAAASPSASAAPNPCPTPTVKPPATPQKFATAPDASQAQGKTWTMTFTTSCGDVVVALDGAKAPKAVASTLFLSEKKFWDGTPCHRLGSEGLGMLQCGDPTGTGQGGPGYQYGPVENAPADGVYKAGTVAMARTSDPNSMGSQFFIVFKDTQLPTEGGGYTVLGQVTSGLDVITKIAAGGVGTPGPDGSGPPARPISIVSTKVASG
ncbi:MAG: peptidyl-prolyl cis-trans isomerase [Actinomycetota bacterium]|nr:peptidyl-prolyl cis-trans isomerase [Actinomycetota bacterium]